MCIVPFTCTGSKPLDVPGSSETSPFIIVAAPVLVIAQEAMIPKALAVPSGTAPGTSPVPVVKPRTGARPPPPPHAATKALSSNAMIHGRTLEELSNFFICFPLYLIQKTIHVIDRPLPVLMLTFRIIAFAHHITSTSQV